MAQLTSKGYPIVLSLRLPVATVAFFDTTKDIGIATEIIGLTPAGDDFVAQLRKGCCDREESRA
jgi:methylmalonyl-CoA/ethylmalonyl-CoA epimerase